MFLTTVLKWSQNAFSHKKISSQLRLFNNVSELAQFPSARCISDWTLANLCWACKLCKKGTKSMKQGRLLTRWLHTVHCLPLSFVAHVKLERWRYQHDDVGEEENNPLNPNPLRKVRPTTASNVKTPKAFSCGSDNVAFSLLLISWVYSQWRVIVCVRVSCRK